jgi:hypothetical protein
MKIFLTLTMLIVFTLVPISLAGQSKSKSKRIERYPHELSGFKLYAKGKWKSLRPFVSTRDDVYRVLGEPSPVFAPYDDDWQVIVHYFESGSTNGRPWGQSFKGTVDNVAFHPRGRVSFGGIIFPRVFKCGDINVSHTPAPLTACSDGTGLSYEIYTGDSDDRSIRKGDLRKIVYGASAKVLKKIQASAGADPKHNKALQLTAR